MSGVVAAAVKSRRGVGEEPLEVVVDVDQDAVEAERGDALERLPLAENRSWL